MEDLFGLLVFAAIAGISMLAKVAEKRKAEQQRLERQTPQTRSQDLPEATRRALYGDGQGPRTAAPRGSEPVPPLPPAPAPQPPWAPAPSGRRLAQAPESRHPSQTMRPQTMQPQPAPRPATEPGVPGPGALQEVYRRTHPRSEQPPASRQQQRRKPPARPPQPQARPAQAPRPAGAHGLGLARLFRDGNAVRRGIIMVEVLGPPKGLR